MGEGGARLRSGSCSQGLWVLVLLSGPKAPQKADAAAVASPGKKLEAFAKKASSRDEGLGQSPQPTRTGRREKGGESGGAE